LAPNDHDPEFAMDGRVYTALLYGNGEGWQGGNLTDYESPRVRENVTIEKAGENSVEVISVSCADTQIARQRK